MVRMVQLTFAIAISLFLFFFGGEIDDADERGADEHQQELEPIKKKGKPMKVGSAQL